MAKSKQVTGFLQNLIKATDNEYAMLCSDENFEGHDFIDTGSYALNALVSGSIYGGLADTKVIGFAGEEATGKTFFTLAAVKHFLDENEGSSVVYFESENALDPETISSRGIDADRIAIVPVTTVEEFRTQCAKILDEYEKQPKDERPKIMFVLDSLGNLSTNKEVADVLAGSDKRDMTKQQLVRGAFRVLTLKSGKVKVPMIVTNHTYQVIGSYVPMKEMAGGGGMKYAASTIMFLTKKQFKEGENRAGSIITVSVAKSRFTREKLKVEVLLHNTRGLDRYFGLLTIAEDAGVVKKVSNKYEFPDGTKAFEKAIIANGEKYFTKDVLDKIDEYTQKAFKYGDGEAPAYEEDAETDD